MKTKLLLIAAAALFASCGTSSSDSGWKTDELRYIPLMDEDDNFHYVDVEKKSETTWGTFEYATLFRDGYSVVRKGSEGYYFMDDKGKFLRDSSYHDVTIFHDGIAWAVESGGPLTAISKSGKVLFELKKGETAYAFHDGYAVFSCADGLWGIVDKKGNVVVVPKWGEVIPMVVDRLIAVKDNEKGWYIANVDGDAVTGYYDDICMIDTEKSFQENYVQALREGRIPVKDSRGNWGIVDKKGNVVINPQFDEIILDGKNYLFCKGYAYGWCDKDGQYIINPQFDEAKPFGDNNIAPALDEKGYCGFIDRKGEWVINPQFYDAEAFMPSGIALTEDENSDDYGAIDKSGKWVINPQYKIMYNYGSPENILVMDQSYNFGIIDSKGRYLISPNYKSAPAELKDNLSGISGKYSATSDYVDIDAYAQVIDKQICSLKSSTTGGLLNEYGLSESRFPKSGKTMTLTTVNDMPDMEIAVKISDVNAWSRESDGWFGYNYTFLPDVPVDSYTLSVEFSSWGKAWRFMDKIFGKLTEKYPYDEENSTFTIPGYPMVLGVVIPDGGMVFNIKTE